MSQTIQEIETVDTYRIDPPAHPEPSLKKVVEKGTVIGCVIAALLVALFFGGAYFSGLVLGRLDRLEKHVLAISLAESQQLRPVNETGNTP